MLIEGYWMHSSLQENEPTTIKNQNYSMIYIPLHHVMYLLWIMSPLAWTMAALWFWAASDNTIYCLLKCNEEQNQLQSGKHHHHSIAIIANSILFIFLILPDLNASMYICEVVFTCCFTILETFKMFFPWWNDINILSSLPYGDSYDICC